MYHGYIPCGKTKGFYRYEQSPSAQYRAVAEGQRAAAPLNTEESNIYRSIYPDKPQTKDRGAAIGGIGAGEDIPQAYRELIRENIEYDVLCSRYGEQRVDGIVKLMLETMLSRRTTIRIAGDDFPRAVVGSRFLKLRAGHIGYVFDCLDRNTTKIRDFCSPFSHIPTESNYPSFTLVYCSFKPF